MKEKSLFTVCLKLCVGPTWIVLLNLHLVSICDGSHSDSCGNAIVSASAATMSNRKGQTDV